ncbi:selenocysteine-specific translation elongation factor, partial [candidate division GN15 bacterium]|nr:selenocysteine-specific translation elongation factor [candidate division GN15 bacterium]
MIVIGTAGHIDHGKSSIVRRLTGADPDRLPEEKQRGMTIDLGFAFHKTIGGQDLAFVDVPGHERFVKNMIAGAGGIDAVMLVIAADDGWMPQSQEHFQIVRLLGVRHGLVVINKCDLVQDDWLELLEADIAEKVDGTFLQDAPVLRVSAVTGDGFDQLTDQLNALASALSARRDFGKARLYIDRSFVRPGMGGVVTGTLRGGGLTTGQTVGIWPFRATARVRTLQSQGQDLDTVQPGHRTAVSFTGIEKEQLVRGGCVSDRTDLRYFADHPVLALNVEMLPEAAVSLQDGREVLLLLGTSEMTGEIRVFESDAIAPGQKGLAFFRPEEPMFGYVGDSCIIRLPTPMVTLGGGRLLDHMSRFPRRKELAGLAYLRERAS